MFVPEINLASKSLTSLSDRLGGAGELETPWRSVKRCPGWGRFRSAVVVEQGNQGSDVIKSNEIVIHLSTYVKRQRSLAIQRNKS